MNKSSSNIDPIDYYEQFIRNRITLLRMGKGISESKLSYELGNSRGYINNVVSGKNKISIGELLKICDYFDITPKDFFDEDSARPDIVCRINDNLLALEAEDQKLVLDMTQRLAAYKRDSHTPSEK